MSAPSLSPELSVTSAPVDRTVLDAVPVALCSVDLDGRVTFANREWARFAAAIGAPEHADTPGIVGGHVSETMPDAAARSRLDSAMGSLRAGHASSLSWELRGADLERARVFLVQAATIAEGHSVAGFAFSATEISRGNHARQQLIESGIAFSRASSVERIVHEIAHQLRRVAGCDAVAVALVDEDPASPRLAHSAGFEQPASQLESALGPTWRRIVAESGHGDDGPLVTPMTAREVPQGTEITAAMTSGGVRGAITALVQVIDARQHHDEITSAIATIAAQAASALERVELIGRESQHRRLEAIGEVAAGVAHELRNPLFGISAAAQLLRFRVRDDPVVEKNVGRVLREVERLNGMVTSLLEYGRPAPLRLAPRDPDELWEDVLAVERGLLESKALSLRHVAAKPRASCDVDAERLTQAFVNVLANAVEASPEGSDLTLTSTVLPNGAWRCRLENAGPPIPADVLPRVFELFFSTKPGGSGIGLALCQRILEEHGGTIAVDSGAEAGTTVTIIIPGRRE